MCYNETHIWYIGGADYKEIAERITRWYTAMSGNQLTYRAFHRTFKGLCK